MGEGPGTTPIDHAADFVVRIATRSATGATPTGAISECRSSLMRLDQRNADVGPNVGPTARQRKFPSVDSKLQSPYQFH